jgi:hypothetical protein
MAGILDFVMAQQARRDAVEERARVEASVRGLLGRPGVLLEGFDDQPAVRAGGTGLLADPGNVERQAAFAGGLMPMMPQQGSALLSGIFGDQAAGQQNAAQISGAEARQRLVNEQSDVESRRSEAGAMRRAELDAQVSRMNALDAAANNLEVAGMRQGGGIPGVELGPVQAGMARIPGPDGLQDVGIPGGEPWVKAREELTTMDRTLQNFQLFDDLFSQSGFELDSVTGQTMQSLRGLLIADVGALQNLGTLQPGDVERLSEGLPDPESLTRFIMQGMPVHDAKRAAREGYAVFRKQVEQRYAERVARYSSWPGMQDVLPQAQPPGQ